MAFEDTEDCTTPRSDDSVIELANLFAEEGVVGNFDVDLGKLRFESVKEDTSALNV